MRWAERHRSQEDAAALVFFSAGVLSLCAIGAAALVSIARGGEGGATRAKVE